MGGQSSSIGARRLQARERLQHQQYVGSQVNTPGYIMSHCIWCAAGQPASLGSQQVSASTQYFGIDLRVAVAEHVP